MKERPLQKGEAELALPGLRLRMVNFSF